MSSCSSSFTHTSHDDSRVFLNINVSWSTFICESQDNDKSHFLSCMLENCLLRNFILDLFFNSLIVLVFYYDFFISVDDDQVSEVAYLCSSDILVKF
jgi:hypothetical protein